MEKIIIESYIVSKDFDKMVKENITIKSLGLKKTTNILKEDIYNVMYEYTIPLYIYNTLVNTSKKYNEVDEKTSKKHFTRTITSPLINDILSTIKNLSSDVLYIKETEKVSHNKKIFIAFNASNEDTKSDLSGGYTGLLTKTQFQFFIGYEYDYKKINSLFNSNEEKMEKKYTTDMVYRSGSFINAYKHEAVNIDDVIHKENYNIFKPLTQPNLSNNSASKHTEENIREKYKIIDYTEERVLFLTQLQNKFITLNNQLNEYLNDINDETIELLIKNNNLNLLP